jgi:hypothetical protein
VSYLVERLSARGTQESVAYVAVGCGIADAGAQSRGSVRRELRLAIWNGAAQ